MNQQTLDDLQALDYPVKIEFDAEEKVYTAEFLDLPGCSADGDTVEEAYRLAIEAKDQWLRTTLEQGLEVPRPSKTLDYSGRILVRMPSSLHAALADKAHLYQASLNQYIVQLLASAAVGYPLERQLEDLTTLVIGCDRRVNQLAGHVRDLTIHIAMNSVTSGFVRDDFSAVPSGVVQYCGSGQEWVGGAEPHLLMA
jgi:antitoxin HicB